MYVLIISRSFAGSILGRLSEMIEGLATPVDLKLKLLPIFQHMHHDAHIATQVVLYTHIANPGSLIYTHSNPFSFICTHSNPGSLTHTKVRAWLAS